jgi:pilus assembly protein CpaB
MSRLTKFAAIALLLAGALLAVMALLNTQQSSQSEALPAPQAALPQVAVVVTARDVPAGQVLTAADVSVQNMAQMPANGFGNASMVVGRSTSVELAQGTPVAAHSLLDGLAGMLMVGERAVSIKVDEASAVGHKLQPGDWVDVFAVFRRDSQEVDTTQARMLLPRKKVLAYGAQLQTLPQGDGKKKEEAKSADRQNPPVARTAVIAVPVEEVNRLLLAEQQGQVLLALRSPLDQHEPSSDKLKHIAGLGVVALLHQDVSKESAALDASLTALTMADLAKDTAAKATLSVKQAQPASVTRTHVRAAPGGANVEVIKGVRKETLKY